MSRLRHSPRVFALGCVNIPCSALRTPISANTMPGFAYVECESQKARARKFLAVLSEDVVSLVLFRNIAHAFRTELADHRCAAVDSLTPLAVRHPFNHVMLVMHDTNLETSTEFQAKHCSISDKTTIDAFVWKFMLDRS